MARLLILTSILLLIAAVSSEEFHSEALHSRRQHGLEGHYDDRRGQARPDRRLYDNNEDEEAAGEHNHHLHGQGSKDRRHHSSKFLKKLDPKARRKLKAIFQDTSLNRKELDEKLNAWAKQQKPDIAVSQKQKNFFILVVLLLSFHWFFPV